jgi:hypothetical protein
MGFVQNLIIELSLLGNSKSVSGFNTNQQRIGCGDFGNERQCSTRLLLKQIRRRKEGVLQQNRHTIR